MAAHSPALCYPGAGWLPIQDEMIRLPLSDGSAMPVKRMLFQKGDAKELVLYWYQTGRSVVGSEYLGKFALLQQVLWSRRSDVAFVRFSTDVTSAELGEAMQGLRDLIRELVPHLEVSLPA